MPVCTFPKAFRLLSGHVIFLCIFLLNSTWGLAQTSLEFPFIQRADSLLKIAEEKDLKESQFFYLNAAHYYESGGQLKRAIRLLREQYVGARAAGELLTALKYLEALEVKYLKDAVSDSAADLYIEHIGLLEEHFSLKSTDSIGHMRWTYYYQNLSYLDAELDHLDQAIKHASQALQMAYRTNNEERIASLLTELGFTYSIALRTREALDTIQKAIEYTKEHDFMSLHMINLNYKARVYKDNGEYEKATALALQAYHLALEPEHGLLPRSTYIFMLGLMDICYMSESSELTARIVSEMGFENVPQFVDSIVSMAKRYESDYMHNSTYERAWRLLLQEGYNDQAKNYMDLYINSRDTFWKAQIDLTNTKFDDRFKVYEAEKEADQLRSRNRLYASIGVFTGFGLILLGFLWWFTRRKNAVIQKKNEELRSLDVLKSQFFTNVSHELRTPLTLVLGPLENALNSKNMALPDRLEGVLRMSLANAQKLEDRVNEILDLSKMEAGKLELVPKATRISDLVTRIVSSFESVTAVRNIHLQTKIELDPDEVRKVDSDKFEKVLNNLINNAIKHSPNGGRIDVGIEEIEGGFMVQVKDQGGGVRVGEEEKIFDRYHQTEEGKHLGGTGIGLALSRQLAMLMQGDVWLEQKVNSSGATFFFTFKAEKTDEWIPPVEDHFDLFKDSSSAAVEAETEFGKRPGVMVVEDNPGLQQYLKNILQSDFRVYLAGDGEEALDLLGKNKIDLITADVMMPNMDGFEFLEQIKKNEDYRNIPVIMVTARADEEDKLAALEIGVDDYIVKPFYSRELLARMKSVLHNMRQRMEAIDDLLGDKIELVNADEQWLRKVKQVIGENLDNETFGVQQLCDEVAMTERTLYRRLKRLIGMTPAAYIKELRLNQGLKLLRSGRYLSVKEVSTALKFSSPQYFSTEFYKRFGKYPSEYFR